MKFACDRVVTQTRYGRSVRRVILVLVCLVGSLPAQFETATVLGTVKDRTDAVISASRVTLTNVETNISAVKDSDENGNYEFVNVKPGRYHVDGG